MSQLHRPKSDGPSPGKISLFHRPLIFHTNVGYEQNIGFRWSKAPHPPSSAYKRFTVRLSGNFDSSFLQIRHWLTVYRDSLLGSKREFLQAPLPLSRHSQLPWAARDFHPLENDHTGRTSVT